MTTPQDPNSYDLQLLIVPKLSKTEPQTIHRGQFGAEACPAVATVLANPDAAGGAAKGKRAAIRADIETVAENEMIGVLLRQADAKLLPGFSSIAGTHDAERAVAGHAEFVLDPWHKPRGSRVERMDYNGKAKG